MGWDKGVSEDRPVLESKGSVERDSRELHLGCARVFLFVGVAFSLALAIAILIFLLLLLLFRGTSFWAARTRAARLRGARRWLVTGFQGLSILNAALTSRYFFR